VRSKSFLNNNKEINKPLIYFNMKNKGFIIFLTVIVTLLCMYYLSFTLVSRSVHQKATAYATDESGVVDHSKRRAYLDSIRDETVYRFLFINYTLEEVNQTKLNLGLDLQGGMHVVLEVSPIDIIKGLSGGSEDPDFTRALAMAEERQRGSQEGFIELFHSSFREIAPNRRLNEIFATAANRHRISLDSSDDAILRMIREEMESAIDRTFNILRSRIDKFGTTAPNIQRLQGTGRIQVELPGADDPDRARRLLQQVAKLEFWEVYELEEIFPVLQAVNNRLVEEQRLAKRSNGTEQIAPRDDLAELLQDGQPEADTLTDDLAAQLEAGDPSALDTLQDLEVSPLFSLARNIGRDGLYYSVRDTARINSILNREDLRPLMRNVRFLWQNEPLATTTGTPLIELVPIKVLRGAKAPLTGDVITDARQDFDHLTGRPSVSMQMNTEGARIWRRMTADNIGRRIAVVLDDYVYSAPMVQSEIPNGNSQITGQFTTDDAKDLANILKAGSLPARAHIVQDVIIGPTLGREAQAQGVISIAAGLGIVILFMFAYYSKGGLVANVALVFNIFFILGILAQLSAALTLPGIAGIVLTIGMAIDANVLIFERIREELRNGSPMLTAISKGYSKAYSSIIDANVTTLVTALFLYVFGLGPVRGFATTLGIGIICSFFSAVFITRVIVTWMTRKGEKSKMSFSTPFTANLFKNLNINFLGKRRIAFMFSGIVIGVGMILLVFGGGLNMGVDFTGGRSYVVRFAEPIPATDMRVALTPYFENAGTEVKTYGANNMLKITTSYLINDETQEADDQVQRALITGIESFTDKQFTRDEFQIDETNFAIVNSSKVGATIADDIKLASIEAIIFSLIGIFIYILIRFKKWQFSLGAIVAIFHDTLVVLSAFAIAGLFGYAFEIDQVFIAAMLTIIGYSINDTVVVFDRIRENLTERPQATIEKTFNHSLNDTISRTLITSATTLAVVLILFVFGGEVLRGFSFALLVGILVGTYSSLFIATPVVVELYKKKIVKAVEPVKVKAKAKV
jgi:SecD/SecF fusion protein